MLVEFLLQFRRYSLLVCLQALISPKKGTPFVFTRSYQVLYVLISLRLETVLKLSSKLSAIINLHGVSTNLNYSIIVFTMQTYKELKRTFVPLAFLHFS